MVCTHTGKVTYAVTVMIVPAGSGLARGEIETPVDSVESVKLAIVPPGVFVGEPTIEARIAWLWLR